VLKYQGQAHSGQRVCRGGSEAVGGRGKGGETPSRLWGVPCRIDDACGVNVCRKHNTRERNVWLGPSRNFEHGRQKACACHCKRRRHSRR
jgi:hypothetical protein